MLINANESTAYILADAGELQLPNVVLCFVGVCLPHCAQLCSMPMRAHHTSWQTQVSCKCRMLCDVAKGDVLASLCEAHVEELQALHGHDVLPN
jgi:hypothetical protein